MSVYEYTDAQLKRLRRDYLRRFNALKIMSFDELNVIETVTEVYDAIIQKARRCFEDILEYYYLYGYGFTSEKEEKGEKKIEENEKKERNTRDNLKPAKGKKTEKTVEKLLNEVLEEYDAVTKYQFFPEAERKKQRLIEAILASKQSTEIPKAKARKTKAAVASATKEIEKALRYWELQVSEYAVKATDRAVLQGYKDAGIKYVRWMAQEDEKVCVTCHRYDGQIFEISAVPAKPHYNCRCWLEAV